MNINGKKILITGGTGSFGKVFIRTLIGNYSPKKVIIFSRDELKQYQMQNEGFSGDIFRYFLGDVRDKERLYRAFDDVDVVVHAAALKQVPAAEYNPMEFIKTNILGAQNIIDASLDSKVSKVIALSTDKAAAPINLYGATKLCSDKLFVAANNLKGWKEISFSVVRYGNVMGSRGSVIPLFSKLKETGQIPITDENMTRFNITLEDGVDFVIKILKNSEGGEIFVPKLPSYRITDMAEAIAPNCKIKIIGIRPGEKIHEEMITKSDSYYTLDFGDHYVIFSSSSFNKIEEYLSSNKATKVSKDFSYSSDTNNSWLTVGEIRSLLKNIVPG